MPYILLSGKGAQFWKSALLLAMCLFPFLIWPQEFQPYFHHFGTEDGLPSSEVYCTQQDHEGYIWIGTDNGVARFNGHSFKVFDGDDGLEDPVVFSIRVDKNGVVWCCSFSGQIFYFQDNRFWPHENNEALKELKKLKSHIKLIDPDYRNGFLIADKYGSFFYLDENQIVKISTNDEYESQIYFNVPNSNSPFVNNQVYCLPNFQTSSTTHNIYNIGSQHIPDEYHLAESIILSDGFIRKIIEDPSAKNAYILFSNEKLFHFVDGEINTYFQGDFSNITYLQPYTNNALLVGRQTGGGISYISNWKDPGNLKIKNILTDRSVSYINFDKSGGLWVSTLDEGLFYSSHPELIFYEQGRELINVQLNCIAPLNDNSFFSNFRDGSTWLHPDIFNSGILLDSSGETNQIRIDKSNLTLTSGGYIAKFDTTDGNLSIIGDRAEYTNPMFIENPYLYKKYLNRPPPYQEETLITTAFSIRNIDKYNKIKLHFDLRLNTKRRLYCYILDWENNHLLGMPEGLFKLDDSCLQLTNIDITSDWVNNRVDDAAYIQGGNILFASKGSGLVLYTPDTFLQITQSDGLLSSLIHRVFVDKNETAWTASSKGLNSVSFNGLRSIVYPKYDDELWEYKSDLQENDDREMRPTVSFRIRSFGQAHGIPNLEIRDIAESENYLWLTTGEGVLKFIPPPFDSFSRKPLIESISLNGKLVDDSYLLELPASSNHFLELNFATLNLAQLGNNHYRYRLGQDTLWREIDQNELSFPSLPRGSYVFEIQSQNPDGIWSQSVILPISVAIPWHAKGWFRLSIVSLLLGLISLFFIRRDRIRQQEFALRQQIQQLERSALQAQMNPHFVFNSLNSIQKFVIRQETKEAVDYLARFAELIRDTLKMSARGLHSLDDEVRMLRHYLDLEKLRFKDGFNYSIEQESWINAKEVMIPPMLIQPFIENAIKHGLRDKKKGGQIDIRFAGDREELRVNILDNGRGFDPRKSKKYDTRERGMDITQRRLELLQKGTYQEKPMEIKLRYNDEGEVCGTEIIIFISTIHRTLS